MSLNTGSIPDSGVMVSSTQRNMASVPPLLYMMTCGVLDCTLQVRSRREAIDVSCRSAPNVYSCAPVGSELPQKMDLRVVAAQILGSKSWFISTWSRPTSYYVVSLTSKFYEDMTGSGVGGASRPPHRCIRRSLMSNIYLTQVEGHGSRAETGSNPSSYSMD